MQLLDVNKIDSKEFHNVRSWAAAVYTANIINQMIRRSKKGDIIFEYENIVKPDFGMDFDEDGKFTGIYLRDGENARVLIVGDRWDAISGKIYCTKRDIREYFKLWRVARITNVSKVADLTR